MIWRSKIGDREKKERSGRESHKERRKRSCRLRKRGIWKLAF